MLLFASYVELIGLDDLERNKKTWSFEPGTFSTAERDKQRNDF
jgi:hypothetical protein